MSSNKPSVSAATAAGSLLGLWSFGLAASLKVGGASGLAGLEEIGSMGREEISSSRAFFVA
jgi:hypothetical protein